MMISLLLRNHLRRRVGEASESFRNIRVKTGQDSINRVINKLIETGSVARKPGSGRPTTATTVENAESVDQLCQSQENEPGTHQSQRKMASTLNISRIYQYKEFFLRSS